MFFIDKINILEEINYLKKYWNPIFVRKKIIIDWKN
jgi:hypothetical protein